MIDQEKEKKEDGLNAKLDEQKNDVLERRQKNAKNERTERPNKRRIDKSLTSADSNSAGAMEPIGSATVTADKSEIKSGPENSGKSLGELSARETVQVIGQVGDELKVIAGGKVGYIRAETTDFSPSQTPAAHKPAAAHRTASVAVAALNVRTGPAKDAAVIGTLRDTDRINVYGEKDGFLEIHVGDQTAYIAAEYTDFAQRYGNPVNDSIRAEIEALRAKDTLTAQEIARLRKLIAHLPELERGDILEEAQKKQAPAADRETDGFEALASCMTFLGIENPTPNIPFAAYLAQLKHIQKVQQSGGFQNWGSIANLMGLSYQALYTTGCAQSCESSFWTQTVREQLRAGCAVMASIDGHPVRITAVDEHGIICANHKEAIAFDKLQTTGLQWAIAMHS